MSFGRDDGDGFAGLENGDLAGVGEWGDEEVGIFGENDSFVLEVILAGFNSEDGKDDEADGENAGGGLEFAAGLDEFAETEDGKDGEAEK